jgi:hypothetical protein
LEGQVPVFILPRNRLAHLYPQALGSVFSTYNSQEYGGGIQTRLHAGIKVKVKIKVRVTLQLAVYHQSVRLGIKPLETHDQRFSFN